MGKCQWHKKKALQKCKTQLVKKDFDKLAEGGASSPPLPPLPVFAEIFQISGRKNRKETIFALENGIFRRKNPPVPTVHAAGHD